MYNPTNYENNITLAGKTEGMLLPDGRVVSMDGFKTRVNNNVTVIATSGGGKTRGYIIPNLLSGVGSYIVSDPKGNLKDKYGDYMASLGYNVIDLNFIHPELSDGFNPLAYIDSPDDIMKISHYITYAGKTTDNHADPFWDRCGELLLSAIIGYMVDSEYPVEKRTFDEIGRLLSTIDIDMIDTRIGSRFDEMMNNFKERYETEKGHTPWCYEQYQKFRKTPEKTFLTIITTIQSNIGALSTPEIKDMMTLPTMSFEKLGLEKTVVFVEVSDTDRSKDILVNTFYSQAMNKLCSFADEKCKDNKLPVPVRFMLDDFGTNCKIDGFENMISNIRSRNISASIVLQSEAQLEKGYESSAHTILENCDTLIYMGGNDIRTASQIATRSDMPVHEILSMPLGSCWLFRRGEKAVFSRTVDLDEYSLMKKLNVPQKENA